MRHGVFGKKLSRTHNERRQLFIGLVHSMLTHGSIKTTVTKAKAVRPIIEQLVTKAKRGTEHDRRMALAVATDRKLVANLFADAKTRFANRTSGFTRIVRVGMRRGDATEEALLQFVDAKVVAEVVKPKVAEPVAKKEAAVKEAAVKKPVKKTVKKKAVSAKK